MGNTARLYQCACCYRQVVICSQCDRGNIYCTPICAEKSRKASLQSAGQRYQDSHAGRLHHAARQSCYRERQQQKVTHHGSLAKVRELSLSPLSKQEVCDAMVSSCHHHCHVCGHEISEFLRSDFLQQTPALLRGGDPVHSQGP